jgi:hypothetical protein
MDSKAGSDPVHHRHLGMHGALNAMAAIAQNILAALQKS